MNLTKDDLLAIQEVVKETVQPMLDNLDDTLSQQTAQGFAAVDKRFEKINSRFEKIDARFEGVDSTLSRIENKLDATIDKVDTHTADIRALNQKVA